MDVHVVGAGLLGCSAALALAEQGHDVVVWEKDQPGAGASHRAAGIVSTMCFDDDDFRLIQETRGRIGELISLAYMEGHEARHVWKPVDSLAVAGGLGRDAEAGLRWLDDVQERLERNTEEPERLDGRTAQVQYPMLRFGPNEQVLVAQEDGVTDAGDLMQLILGRLAAEEVSIRTGTATLQGGFAVDGVAQDADAVVVAGGAWTRGLFEAAGVPLPLQAFRTQAATVDLPREVDVPIVHDIVHGFYVRPDGASSVLAGDGTRLTDHDPESYNQAAGPRFREHVSEGLVQRLEVGAEARWRTGWAGLCVATPDRRPLVGPVPELENTYVLTGDNGFGLMRCLGLGERVADALRGRIESSTALDRFADRGHDFEMREGYAP